MERALERALDRADYVIASAQQRPPKRKYSPGGEKSLYEKLYDIYVEECGKEPEVTEELRSNVNLLEKLVRRESLPCLVVNLYPGEGGYSLMLKGKDGSYLETIRLPYEEGELLEYLDAEELPPVLVDLLEKSEVNVFHCGCVIAEIRDYRQSSTADPPGYQSRHILLRPTMQTLACDVESITSDNQKWTQEDKLLLESQLILATAEPLCLDPSVSVACTANRLLYNKQKMSTGPMKRSFKRYSTPSLRRQQELSHGPPPPELRVPASRQTSTESKAGEQGDLTIPGAGNCVDMWKQRPCDLAVPSEVDVEKYAQGKNSVNYDDSQPPVWAAHEVKDDSPFEWEAGDHYQEMKLLLMHSLNDPLISGREMSRKKVRCERQMSPPDSSSDDDSDSLVPGSKTDAGRVVSQSEELVQKNSSCPVKMSHSSSGSANLSPLSPGKETAQPKPVFVQPSVPEKEVTPPPPPVSLPSSSGRSSSGSSFTPQQASSFHNSPSPAPASKPPSLSQKSSVEENRVSTLPAATLSTAGSSQRTLATQVTVHPVSIKVIKVVSPLPGAQALGRGPNALRGAAPQAEAPAGIKPSNPSPRARPLEAPPAAPKAPSRASVRVIFRDVPGGRPFTVLQVPRGSLILNTQLPPQQPQQRQQLYQLITQQPCQQPPTSPPQQPVSRGSSAQGSTSQKSAISAQQAVVINVGGSFLHPLPIVLSPCGSAQRRPGQSLPQQRAQLSSALQQPKQQHQRHQLHQQQPQQQPQQLQQQQQQLPQKQQQLHQKQQQPQQLHQKQQQLPQKQQQLHQKQQQPDKQHQLHQLHQQQQQKEQQQPQQQQHQKQQQPLQLHQKQRQPQQRHQQQPQQLHQKQQQLPQHLQQQQQPQQVQQLRILQPPVAVAPAAAQTAQPPRGHLTASQSPGKMSAGAPTMPKS